MVVIQENHNGLATEWLVSVLVVLTTDFLRSVRKLVLDLDRQDLGREILGEVAGRNPNDDKHGGVDKKSEELFAVFCTGAWVEHGIKFWIRSEHNQQGYGIGCDSREEADVECDIDPFDGTDQYVKRFREAWWSALTFSRGGVPLVGGTVDILVGILYLAYGGRVEEVSIRTGRRKRVLPRQEWQLNAESVVTAYKGRWKFISPWVERVEQLFSREDLEGTTHTGNGGSFVYSLLAAGVLSAYIMEEEPVSEISPGAAFVQTTDLCLLLVKGGNITKLNPLLGMEGHVEGVLVAACTEELAWDIAEQLQDDKQ